jgi:hypothetical protein
MEQSVATVHVPGLLQGSSASLATGQASLKPLVQGNTQLSLPTLQQTTIHLIQQLTHAVDTRVERMGRYGWRGRITQISAEHALVDWGGSTSWTLLYELYPLDEDGYPIHPGVPGNVFASARRGRAAIESASRQDIPALPNEPENNQTELF